MTEPMLWSLASQVLARPLANFISPRLLSSDHSLVVSLQSNGLQVSPNSEMLLLVVPKVKTTSAMYSDAGLLYTLITGSADAVASTAKASVDAIKKIAAGEISGEEFAKAKAAAKFKELDNGQDIRAGLELTGNGLVSNTQPYQIDEVAKQIDGVSEKAVKAVSLPSLET